MAENNTGTGVLFRTLAFLSLATGSCLIVAAAVFNVWMVEAWFVADHSLEWPNTFYLYLAQGALFVIGLALVLGYRFRDAVDRYFGTTSLKVLALHALLLLVTIDVAMQVVFALVVDHPGESELGLLYSLFHLNLEKNVPSTWSALQLVLAGIAALYCMRVDAHRKVGFMAVRYAWLFAAITLFYLAVDEYFSIHETGHLALIKLGLLSPDYDDTLGGFGRIWTVAAGLLVLLVGIPAVVVFTKVFAEHRYLFYLLGMSGFLFVFGAVGMENVMVYLKTYYVEGLGNKPIVPVVIIEEFLEMFAVSLALFVFLRYSGEVLEASGDAAGTRPGTNREGDSYGTVDAANYGKSETAQKVA